MQWFRLYAEFASDPKVQMMPEQMQRRLVMLMCLRCSEQLDGASDAEIAFALRLTQQDIDETKALFQQKKFIDSRWKLINWDERQMASDTSSARVKKYRENRKALGLASNGYTKHTVTVTERDCSACVYCGSTSNLCIDHILPTAQGGTDDVDNLCLACKECNSGKAGRTPEQAGYSFFNKAAEKRWAKWMASRRVTVTANGQNRTEQNRVEEKREEKEKTGAEPQSGTTQELAGFAIPTNKGDEFQITAAMFKEFADAYPAVDVSAELRAMRVWCLSNKANRKTESGILRFANGWLKKSQNSAPTGGKRRTSDGGPDIESMFPGAV